MSQRPIMDAGPGINFFSVNKERLLFSVLGPLCVPEAVEAEILRKARQEKRFAAAERVWKKLTPKYLEILSDDVTNELALAVQRIGGIPFDQRTRIAKDLGEVMVIAHATVTAEAGDDVIVLIDDGKGCHSLTLETRRIQRMRDAGKPVGSIRLVNTVTVLEGAAGTSHIADRNAMRQLYGRLRALDDGLLPLENTNLLTLPCWSQDNPTDHPE